MKWYGNEKIKKSIEANAQSNTAERLNEESSLNQEQRVHMNSQENNMKENQQETFDTYRDRRAEQTDYQEPAYMQYDEEDDDDDELSIIEAKTTVNGNIECDGNLTIEGEVNGDLIVTGRVVSNGQVVGKTKAKNLEMTHSVHQGDVECEQVLLVRDVQSSIIGNITAQECEIYGHVEGNITVKGKCSLGHEAVVLGDVQAGMIEIAAGAIMKGHLEISMNGKEE